MILVYFIVAFFLRLILGDPHPVAGLPARHRGGDWLLHPPLLRHPPRQHCGYLIRYILLKILLNFLVIGCYLINRAVILYMKSNVILA